MIRVRSRRYKAARSLAKGIARSLAVLTTTRELPRKNTVLSEASVESRNHEICPARNHPMYGQRPARPIAPSPATQIRSCDHPREQRYLEQRPHRTRTERRNEDREHH